MASQEAATGGPIFVVGAMGSGTTLLRLILDSHENIAVAQETGFMRAIVANKWIPFWKFGGEWYARLGWTDDELNEQLREFYDHLFSRFASDQGKRRWGDKTPYHTWHMPEAARVFPDASFVAMVRHPGAVSLSLHQRFSYGWPKAVGHWVRSNLELLHRAEELGDRIVVCRYEDLVLDPEPVLRELLDWLDEPWSARVLEHHKVHEERGTPEKVEGRTRSNEPIDVARITRWAASMDAEGYEVLQRDAARLAEFFGYRVDEPSPFAPLESTSGRSHLVTGDDLVKRQAAFGMTNWGPWPKPSMANQQLQPRRFEVVAKRKVKMPGRSATTDVLTRPPGPAPHGSARVAVYRAVRTAFQRLPESGRQRVRRLTAKAARTVDSW